ncbi:MAG TPA: prolyl-tRNA synthetase associated domain-containing protein [Bacteroidales bacterium]|nr:prolyl-tRNA synthetase associated domain-containing protein [Bacteroidales bacterium]
MNLSDNLHYDETILQGSTLLYEILNKLNIKFDYYEHPPAPTVEVASKYWSNIEATHCKNLFFRNHKGDKHYLVIIDYKQTLPIKKLENKLKQGKLTFASPQRLMKYLGLNPGSVTPFGLINDINKEVYVFIDENLKNSQKISFHPCINTASIVISYDDFLKFLKWVGNPVEYIKLY